MKKYINPAMEIIEAEVLQALLTGSINILDIEADVTEGFYTDAPTLILVDDMIMTE